MVGALMFIVGIALWICKSNDFLIVNGWIVFLCLTFGFFMSMIENYAKGLAKNVNVKLTEEIAKLKTEKEN